MNQWEIVHGSADSFRSAMLDIEKAKLIWTDPPFGTGKRQRQGEASYLDSSDHGAVIEGLRSVSIAHLHEDGTLAVICDYRLAYELVPAITEIGLTLRGEIIWEFGLGRPRTSWWPNRHNHILTFTWTEDSGHFDSSAVPRVRRLAPKPGYPDDKPSGSVWEHTMSNTDPQRVGYPNQKPIELIEPFVLAHTLPGDIVLDPYCGSSSTGAAAMKHGRRYIGVDSNKQAIEASYKRLIEIAQ